MSIPASSPSRNPPFSCIAHRRQGELVAGHLLALVRDGVMDWDARSVWLGSNGGVVPGDSDRCQPSGPTDCR